MLCCAFLWQGEIFAAEGYAKTTGRVGVCIATSGPGATNLVTGLADAMMDSVPLVAITGQVCADREGGAGSRGDAGQQPEIATVKQVMRVLQPSSSSGAAAASSRGTVGARSWVTGARHNS